MEPLFVDTGTVYVYSVNYGNEGEMLPFGDP